MMAGVLAGVMWGTAIAVCHAGTVRINEVMASNGATIADEDGEYPDWIELHNYGTAPVDLSGWGLSDNRGSPFKWRFPPATLIDAGGYLVVWASGKNRTNGVIGIERDAVAAGASWRYHDLGQDLGTAWQEPAYDDSGWASGPAPLGYGPQPQYVNTVISFGGNPTNKHIRTYFRHAFNVPDAASVTALHLRVWLDDGAVVYLNSTEIARENLPAGPLDYQTRTLTWIGEWPVWSSYSVAPGVLVNGTNVLAVAVHQQHPASSDLAFNLALSTAGQRVSLHTSFAIAAGGEDVVLTAADGTRVDMLPPTELPRDVSIGRGAHGGTNWYYFDAPTPWAANATTAYTSVLAPVQFSHQGGFYSTAFTLTLTHPDPQAAIVYTLDGSAPAPGNIGGTSYMYKNYYPEHAGDPVGTPLYRSYQSLTNNVPIAIVDRSAQPDALTKIATTFPTHLYIPPSPVRKGMVVRARAYKPGALSPAAGTHTYVVSPSANDFTLPVITLTVQEDDLYDFNHGIYTPGANYSLNNLYGSGNYHMRGDEWERRAHLAFFETGAARAVLSQEIGLRIHGGVTRWDRLKSLRIYARSEYGAATLDQAFFPELPDHSFKRIVLRNSGNDFWHTLFRDAAIHAIMDPLRIDTQAYRPAVHFINGEYWGIINIRERYDKHYLARVYGVDAEKLDFLTRNAIVEEGDALHFNALREYMRTNNMAQPRHYEHAQTQMDMENFTDYQIANIFLKNTDWPGNNIDYWRLRTASYQPQAPYGHDGRWRWMLFDTDHGFGLTGGTADAASNMLTFATATNGPSWPNPEWSTFLLRTLLQNATFKTNFITRFADLLNTAFLPERMVSIITQMQQQISAELPRHVHRWQRPHSIAFWSSQVDVMCEFARQRPAWQRQHLREFFRIAGQADITVTVNDPVCGHVRINTIDIDQRTPGVTGAAYPWTGVYFRDFPLTLTAVACSNAYFVDWHVTPAGAPAYTATNRTLVLVPSGAVSVSASFAPVAEPASVTLLGLGVLLYAALRSRAHAQR